MSIHRELFEFERGQAGAVLEQLATLADGSWMNIEPVIDETELEDLRARTPHPILRIFSARGRPIPFGTIVAAADGYSVGLEHGRGAPVVRELRDVGVRAPSSWQQEQDHARRGVVYTVPRDESPAALLDWLLDAATALSDVPIRGQWSAVVASPS
ncbi:MAG TPA: hypothetical protein VGQ20_00980 [Acidimicrobiales bacterium]|jgi:hypothetical protein|nr:hypothetical protein [Acidimicrobiales bacterium]